MTCYFTPWQYYMLYSIIRYSSTRRLSQSKFPDSKILSLDEQSLLVACLFRSRNSRSNYNAVNYCKIKPLCNILKWALNDFGRNFRQVSEIYARTICFSDNLRFQALKSGWTNLIACPKQEHKVMRERRSALNFASVQISNFKHSHDQWILWKRQCQASTNILMKIWFMQHFGQSWQVFGVAITALHIS